MRGGVTERWCEGGCLSRKIMDALLPPSSMPLDAYAPASVIIGVE